MDEEVIHDLQEVIEAIYYNDKQSAQNALKEFWEYKEGRAPFLLDGEWKEKAETLEPWQWWKR